MTLVWSGVGNASSLTPRSALSLESVMAKYATQGNVQMPPLPFQGLEVLTAQTFSLGPTPSFMLILNNSNETAVSEIRTSSFLNPTMVV